MINSENHPIDMNTYIQRYVNETSNQPVGTNSLSYNQCHALRFYNSYQWISEYLNLNNQILELGGGSLLGYMIQDLHPSITLEGTNTDLRYELDLLSQTYDFILNMKVIEHIKDQNTDNIWEVGVFNKSGINTLMTECYRLLKNKGFMFLTTPNLTSLDNIHRILSNLPPINYYPHVREFSVSELQQLAELHKFTVIKTETFNNWNEYQPGVRQEMMLLLKQYGYPTEYRGDNIFMLLQKL